MIKFLNYPFKVFSSYNAIKNYDTCEKVLINK